MHEARRKNKEKGRRKLSSALSSAASYFEEAKVGNERSEAWARELVGWPRVVEVGEVCARVGPAPESTKEHNGATVRGRRTGKVRRRLATAGASDTKDRLHAGVYS